MKFHKYLQSQDVIGKASALIILSASSPNGIFIKADLVVKNEEVQAI